jgi:hypothetical protein
VNSTRWQCKKRLGEERGKGQTSLYYSLDLQDEKLMKLFPLRWNEGNAARCNEVRKRFFFAPSEATRCDMMQSKLMRAGHQN